MTDEVMSEAGVTPPVSDQDVTVTPVAEDVAPEETPVDAKPPRTFTQEEMDAAIGKRLAREQRKWERDQASKQATAHADMPSDSPTIEQFESPEAYAEALAEQKAVKLVEAREAQKRNDELSRAYHEREEEAFGKYADFEQVAYNQRLPITQVMAETIRSSDVGPEIAYYLGSNIKEAERISHLPPYSQAKEIGRIEAKLASDPPVKKVSGAPSPITPVTPRTANGTAYDTTDPRSIKSMSTSEWIAAERARQVRKAEAKQNAH